MGQAVRNSLSRRKFVKAAGAAGILSGMVPAILPGRARARSKTLRILRYKHFVRSYDVWHNETFIREWGEKNDTEVIVDNVGLGEISGLASAEAEAGQGHDLVLFLAPPPTYEDSVINHQEIYQECANRYGKAADFAIRSSYNPRTDKYYAFCDGYAPAVINYREDLWEPVGGVPDSWDDVLSRGRKIKFLNGASVGISLAAEHNSNYSLRSIMYAFGSSVQDSKNNPALKSKETLEALKFVKALYREAMTEDVLTWDPPSNNRFILAGDGSFTVDTLSIARAAEKKNLPVNSNLRIARLPEGPAGRIGTSFSMYTYVIWKFAANIDGAKQFLIDLIGESAAALKASGFQNMPSFPGAVPDLNRLVSNDAVQPERYQVLRDVPAITTNLGHPGYANAAIDEVYGKGLIPVMFAQAATGQMSPEEAMGQAEREAKEIFVRWREAGKV